MIAFGKKYLGDESWTMDGVGEGAEKELLQQFGAVSRVFNTLPAGSQDVIRDITIKMGQGMAGARFSRIRTTCVTDVMRVPDVLPRSAPPAV